MDLSFPNPLPDLPSPNSSRAATAAPSTSTSLLLEATSTSPSTPGSSTSCYPFLATAALDKQAHGNVFNVLIAEDNPLNGRLLETRLKRRGHTVQVVVDGKACVDAFKDRTEAFDIILMDIQVSAISKY
jgi:CheY-like chemotaxis protein